MAVTKTTYSAETVMTVTGLQSLANSATAGWSSGTIDNTSNLYLDALVQVMLDPANTAPANDATFYLFVWGGEDSDEMPTTGAASGSTVGTEGALTFPSIATTLQSLQSVVIPYTAQDVAIKTQTFSVCSVLGLPFGCLPPYWGVALLNYSGAALAASGNAVKWRGVTLTSA